MERFHIRIDRDGFINGEPRRGFVSMDARGKYQITDSPVKDYTEREATAIKNDFRAFYLPDRKYDPELVPAAKETIEVTDSDTVEIWFDYADGEKGIALFTHDNGHLAAARKEFDTVKETGRRITEFFPLGFAVKKATLKRGRRRGEGGSGRVIERHVVK